MAETPASRIAEIPEDKQSPEQKAALAALVKGRGRVLTPYKIWLHSPKVALAMEQLGTYLNKASSLSEREVELAIALVAHHWRGDYVFTVHAKRCRELGLPESAIEAIRQNRLPDLASPRERAICEVAKAAQEKGPGEDAMFDRAVAVLGRNGLAELLALLGYYSAVAMAMKLHRVPIPAT